MQKERSDSLVLLEIFLPITTYYWNMVQIRNAFVHFYYSWRLYYDMIFAVPIIYFFSDFSSKELLNSESEEKDESLEM